MKILTLFILFSCSVVVKAQEIRLPEITSCIILSSDYEVFEEEIWLKCKMNNSIDVILLLEKEELGKFISKNDFKLVYQNSLNNSKDRSALYHHDIYYENYIANFPTNVPFYKVEFEISKN
jgi:phosphoribosyl 1,2-cyclic phosphodiesterase